MVRSFERESVRDRGQVRKREKGKTERERKRENEMQRQKERERKKQVTVVWNYKGRASRSISGCLTLIHSSGPVFSHFKIWK